MVPSHQLALAIGFVTYGSRLFLLIWRTDNLTRELDTPLPDPEIRYINLESSLSSANQPF
jgi:hypothetical protein